jgi:hypothetical protein
VRADGEERGVVAAFLHRSCDVRHLGVELDGDAHLDDALHLGIEHVARQAVLRNAEAHHPAQPRPGLEHRDRVPEPAQLVRRRTCPKGRRPTTSTCLPVSSFGGVERQPLFSASSPRSARPS